MEQRAASHLFLTHSERVRSSQLARSRARRCSDSGHLREVFFIAAARAIEKCSAAALFLRKRLIHIYFLFVASVSGMLISKTYSHGIVDSTHAFH